MADAPVTRASLVARLRHGQDEAAWREFAAVYGPVIHGFYRHKGLQDADAADLTQQVLVNVASQRQQFEPTRGKFRNWLFTFVQRRLVDFHRRRPARGSGDTAVQELLEGVPAEADAVPEWEAECERQIYRLASEQVRQRVTPETWQAFHLTAVEGRDPKEVAARLGKTLAAVYLAKGRVMTLLREEIQRLEGE